MTDQIRNPVWIMTHCVYASTPEANQSLTRWQTDTGKKISAIIQYIESLARIRICDPTTNPQAVVW